MWPTKLRGGSLTASTDTGRTLSLALSAAVGLASDPQRRRGSSSVRGCLTWVRPEVRREQRQRASRTGRIRHQRDPFTPLDCTERS